MAFLPSIPPDSSRNLLMPKYLKRAVMHVDQVIIQTEQLPRIGGNWIPNLQVPCVPISSLEYSNDQFYGPPKRKRMKYNGYNNGYSQRKMSEEVKAENTEFFSSPLGTTNQQWNKKIPRNIQESAIVPDNPVRFQDTDSSSETLSDADLEWLQEKASQRTQRMEEQRNRKIVRRLRKHKTYAPYVPPPAPYANQPVSDAYCNELPPVEVQIQECPGLPKMRAYVVVPLGKTGTHDREKLEIAARKAANAVPPHLRVARRPQAVVVQCGRNSRAVSRTIPCSTNIPLAIESSERVLSRGSTSAPAPAPNPDPTISASFAIADVAAIAARTDQCGDTDLGQVPISTHIEESESELTLKRVYKNIPKNHDVPESISKFLYEDTPNLSSLEENHSDLKGVSVASSLASMDCCTFICKLPNVLNMMEKSRRISRSTILTKMSEEIRTTH